MSNIGDPLSEHEALDELRSAAAARKRVRPWRGKRSGGLSGGMIALLLLTLLFVGGGIVTVLYMSWTGLESRPAISEQHLAVAVKKIDWFTLRTTAPSGGQTGELFSGVRDRGSSQPLHALVIQLGIHNEADDEALYESFNGASRAALRDPARGSVENTDPEKLGLSRTCLERVHLAPGSSAQDLLAFTPEGDASREFDLILPGKNLRRSGDLLIRIVAPPRPVVPARPSKANTHSSDGAGTSESDTPVPTPVAPPAPPPARPFTGARHDASYPAGETPLGATGAR